MIINSRGLHRIAHALSKRIQASVTIAESQEGGGTPQFKLTLFATKADNNLLINAAILSLKGAKIGHFIISRPAPRTDGHFRRLARDLAELAEEIALDHLDLQQEGPDDAAA